MRLLSAWFGFIGGILWIAKSGYDWIGLGREVNRGYPPSHFTDYIEFLIPLLCIGSMYVLASFFRESLSKAPLVISIGLILTGAFHFSDAVFVDSGVPFGLLFLFTGLITTFFGVTLLAIRIKKSKHIPRSLFGLAVSLNLMTILLVLSPFLREFISNEQLTVVTVGLSMLIGAHWSCIGMIAIVLHTNKLSSTKELQL